jgi:hypothetical protein
VGFILTFLHTYINAYIYAYMHAYIHVHATALGRRRRVIRRWSMSKLLRPSRATTPTLTCEQDINKQARQAHTLSKQGTHSYIHTYIHTYIHVLDQLKKNIFLPSILLSNIHPQCYFRTNYILYPSIQFWIHTFIHTYIHTHIHLFIQIHAGNIIHTHQYLWNG